MATWHPREELISAMVDGKLNVAETLRVAAHLNECGSCRAILEDFERNKAMFRALPDPEMPPQQFWDDTFRKMRVGTAVVSPSDINRTRLIRARRQLQAAFAVAACIAGAMVVAPLAMHKTTVIPIQSVQPAAIAEDTLDIADVNSFVHAHTESAAKQPLGDPDRQQMIASEADMNGPDDFALEASANADVVQ